MLVQKGTKRVFEVEDVESFGSSPWGFGKYAIFGPILPVLKRHLSNEKNPGCLGDYTTQLYGDYHKPL